MRFSVTDSYIDMGAIKMLGDTLCRDATINCFINEVDFNRG